MRLISVTDQSEYFRMSMNRVTREVVARPKVPELTAIYGCCDCGRRVTEKIK